MIIANPYQQANIPNISLHHKAQFGDEFVSMHSIYFEYDINIPHVLLRNQVKWFDAHGSSWIEISGAA